MYLAANSMRWLLPTNWLCHVSVLGAADAGESNLVNNYKRIGLFE